MQNDDNPFKAPDARVDDLFPGSGSFIPDGQRVPAGNGLAWLVRGWEMFRKAPFVWIVLSLIFGVIFIVLGIIPGLNLVLNLLIPVFVGGIMIGCKALEDGEELRIEHLFAGFSGHTGNLMLIGLIYLAGILGLVIVMALVGGLGFGAVMLGGGISADAAAGLSVLAMLVAMLLFVPLAMAVWYAPPLVVFHEVPPLEAVKASFFASLKNFVPFLVYGLVFVVLAMLASLPFLLGWLVLMPVIQASVYAGYRDMFIRH